MLPTIFISCSGYMAPEYVMHGQFSVKSDVFSFGVLLLEIISGQRNNGYRHGEDIIRMVRRNPLTSHTHTFEASIPQS